MDMFVYLLYIKEAYVYIFRVTINDVQDDPCLILFGLWYLGVLHIWNKLHHCGKHVITLEDVVYYVTTTLMVLGVQNDVQIGELHLKWCTNCARVCSVNMFINMQYIQWGQFKNFLFLMMIIHFLKNSDFICKLNVCANETSICILILYFW